MLIFFVSLTQQVDIIISGGLVGNVITATCPNIPAGLCCHAPAGSQTFAHVTMSNLLAGDIGALWGRRASSGNGGISPARINACSSVLTETRAGPGDWLWTQWDPAIRPFPLPAVGGASYISLPRRLPVDPMMNSWLAAEGLLGLVWGGGQWFASAQAQKVLRVEWEGRRPAKRGIRSKEKGYLWARRPMREVFPRWIDINGTRYSDDGRGDLMYEDEAGSVLNLTNWFDQY
ncbi:MAG: hypothetical protein Q9200_006708 [Gallowayella weberi]